VIGLVVEMLESTVFSDPDGKESYVAVTRAIQVSSRRPQDVVCSNEYRNAILIWTNDLSQC